ncbi:MAG: ATP-dependent zinc metalloprotease FtsH [Mycoplasmoidaceae bacterium]
MNKIFKRKYGLLKTEGVSEEITAPPANNPKPPKPPRSKPTSAKAGSATSERVKKRQKIVLWSGITFLLVGGIAFWQFSSTFTPPVRTVTDINYITDNSNKQELKFSFGANSSYTYREATNLRAVYGATTGQISLYIDTNALFQGFIMKIWIDSNDNFIIGGYEFNPKTGVGTPIGGESTGKPILTGTEFNKDVQSILANATAPVIPFNPLATIISFLPFIILIGILFWSMRAMTKSTSGNDSVFGIGKSQAKVAESDVKFTDVAGIEEEKNELIEIVDYLRHPSKYAAMGARTPKGVMLYGPPGTGKTLLARAVAGEAHVPFFQASGSSFEDMLVGVGAKRIRDLFSKAAKAAPSIIFIDEIDSVASKRGKFDSSGGIGDQTINQLLSEMDGFEPNNGVIVMAATNRLDVLDPAVIRPGRFDRHISVDLPDIRERAEILKIHARNKNISSSVNLEDIARRTPGFSGAQLENVLNEATLLAVREDKNVVSTIDIDEAIDRVIAGPAKQTRVISPDEQKQIAYHEAGHALVGLHTPGSDVVQKITIIPRGKAAGYTLSTPEKQELSVQRKTDLLAIIASTLGGRAAEEIIYGKDKISTGASNDLFKVTNIVKSMVTQLGMSDLGMTQYIPSEGTMNPYQNKFYSNETAQLIDNEINKIINKQYEYARNIINKNKKELDLIVESLIILETLTKPQIDYIHTQMKLPQEAIDKKADFIASQKKMDQEDKEYKESKRS